MKTKSFSLKYKIDPLDGAIYEFIEDIREYLCIGYLNGKTAEEFIAEYEAETENEWNEEKLI